MTYRRPLVLSLSLALSLASAPARAQSFVERLSGGACDQARSFEVGDTSPAAQSAWRACRLERFEERLQAERRAEMAAQAQAREARLQAWLAGTQPLRVARPLAVELFAGSGIPSYGVGASWFVLRRLELAGRIGWRELSHFESVSLHGSARYDARTIGGGARWLLGDKDFAPFVGAGLAFSAANIEVNRFNVADPAVSPLVIGIARAHSASASAGLQLAVRAARFSFEYVYEYVFYTGANLANAEKTPDNDMRVVWRDSLTKDRHGIRVQAGYAF